MSEIPAPVEKAKSYERGPLPGGSLPDVGKLLAETFADFGDNIGPYLLAGLGHFVVLVPVVIVMVLVTYGVVFGGMLGTMAVGGALSGLLAEVAGDELAGLGVSLTMVLSLLVTLALMVGMVALAGALLAPLNASLVRAIARHQRGEEALSFGSAFTHATDDLVATVLVAVATIGISLALLSMCYLPVLAVPVLLPFAGTLVALHRRGAVDGLRTAFRHSTGNLSWYLMFGLLTFVGGMVAGYVPVLGSVFMTAFHVRAYRHVFGDGPEPVI